MGPSSGKEQQCGGDPKLSRHRVVDTHTCVQRAHKGMGHGTGRSNRDHAMQRTHSSAGWFFHLGGLSWSEGAQIINKTGGCF